MPSVARGARFRARRGGRDVWLLRRNGTIDAHRDFVAADAVFAVGPAAQNDGVRSQFRFDLRQHFRRAGTRICFDLHYSIPTVPTDCKRMSGGISACEMTGTDGRKRVTN